MPFTYTIITIKRQNDLPLPNLPKGMYDTIIIHDDHGEERTCYGRLQLTRHEPDKQDKKQVSQLPMDIKDGTLLLPDPNPDAGDGWIRFRCIGGHTKTTLDPDEFRSGEILLDKGIPNDLQAVIACSLAPSRSRHYEGFFKNKK